MTLHVLVTCKAWYREKSGQRRESVKVGLAVECRPKSKEILSFNCTVPTCLLGAVKAEQVLGGGELCVTIKLMQWGFNEIETGYFSAEMA